MRVIFMGSPGFAVHALDALADAGHDIVAVYCQPPRRAGRGRKDRPTAVHLRALALGLLVRTPVNFKDPADVQAFAALNADTAVVAAYGLILPAALLGAPKYGALNIHASLLPRWRGAAPIHRAILAGDAKTGVCIMQMDAGLDTGPVVLWQETDIAAQSTMAGLHDKLADIGAQLIARALDEIETLVPRPQAETGVTYAAKIAKSETRIDWQQPAVQIDRQIRALSPFPGAWCLYNGERLKLLDSRLCDAQGAAGEVLDHNLTIACGSDAILVRTIQRAGKSAMPTADALRGFDLPFGSRLE